MGRPLIERMAVAVEVFFKADQALTSTPSFETLQVAKEASVAYHEAEHREYKAMMVEDGTWDQGDCDLTMQMSDECNQAYQAWLHSVEKELLDPSSKVIVESITESIAITPSLILQPIVSVPVLPKARDRAFF